VFTLVLLVQNSYNLREKEEEKGRSNKTRRVKATRIAVKSAALERDFLDRILPLIIEWRRGPIFFCNVFRCNDHFGA
jgi:hypothetical protein